MQFIDLSENPRIPVLLETMRALGDARRGADATNRFTDGMRRAYGGRGFVALTTADVPEGSYRVTRFVTAAGENLVPPSGSYFANPDGPVHEGGALGALTREARPRLARGLDLAGDSVYGDALAPYRSAVAVPLPADADRPDWAILLSEEEYAFDEAELEQLIVRANMLRTAIRNAELAVELERAQEAIQREIESIASIQQQLLPEGMPRVPGLLVDASYETFDRAGGDFYDIFPIDGWLDRESSDLRGRWAFLIADVSGHGASAAVVTAMLHSILHSYPTQPERPGEMLRYLNRHLLAKKIELSFVTAFLGFYDPSDRSFLYARAGHNAPVWKHGDGSVEFLYGKGGLPLSVLPDQEYAEATITLEPGDALLLYTDGITETADRESRLFGTEGIEKAMAACVDEAPG